MKTQNIDSVRRESPDILSENIEQLKCLFPESITEGKIDWDKLKAALGEFADERPERYSFTWAGKRDAIRLLQTPSRATLVPAKEESVNFERTQNIFIEGDNLEVLKLLYKAYFGRVKMIYIDPPYNTGNDFVYPDNYTDPLDTYLKLTGQKDAEGNILTSNPETSGRYHSAWLSMMYPRLFVGAQLLTGDGLIFVSIDDKELYNLRLLMNEVFGEENFVDNIIWKKRYGGGAKEKYLVSLHEYIVVYAKNKEELDPLFVPTDPDAIERYYKSKDDKFEIRGPYRTHPLEATKSMGERKNLVYPIPAPDASEIWPTRQWLWERERAIKAVQKKELEFVKGKDGWSVHTKQYLKDENGNIRQSKAFSVIDDVYTQHGTNEIIDLFGDAQIFPFPKPTGLIKPIIQLGVDHNEEDIVLDFFAGSCTAAQALLQLNRADAGNRRYIMVQLPEPLESPKKLQQGTVLKTVADIGKERIRRVIKKMQQEGEGKLALQTRESPEDLGFKVFKLAQSNYKPWTAETKPEAYVQQVEMFVDPLVEGWKRENVIYEVAVKEGYGLNCVIEPVSLTQPGSVQGKAMNPLSVYRVTDPDKDQSFYITLDETINLQDLEPLNLKKDNLFICRDRALNDEVAANLALQCRLKTI